MQFVDQGTDFVMDAAQMLNCPKNILSQYQNKSKQIG